MKQETERANERLAETLKNIRRIELRTRRLVNDVFSGEYHSVFKGQGMEFDEVREYQPGDEIRSIDWNVTARTGEPHIKRFMEERELVVMFLLDVSASGRFGSVERTKLDTAAEICALLAFSAIQNNDKVGAVMFTDEVEAYIPPEKGKKHVLHVIRELLMFEPKGRRTNVSEALTFLMRVWKRRAIVFVLSDFIAPDFVTELAMASRKFDIVALHIRDPRELDVPAGGLVRVWDQETGQQVTLDTNRKSVARFRAAMAERDQQLASSLRRAGVDLVPIDTGSDYIKPLTRFFKAREKRR